MIKLKFTLMRFLRHQMLNPIPEGVDLANSAVKMILKELKQHIDLSVDDYCQIY
jgi:hypothetical protein